MQKFIGSLLITGLVAACGAPAKKTYHGEDDGAGEGSEAVGGVAGIGTGTSGRQLVTIPVSLVNKLGGASGLALASATTFTINLTNCATGYTSTADEGSTALQVYKYDKGCKAKLATFEYNGRTYIPTAGDPFTTWAANDTATFDEAGEPGTAALYVKVLSTLADPVSGNEAVTYQFAELIKGATKSIAEATVGAAHALTVDDAPPPSFTIKSVSFDSVSVTGQGRFTFTMECTSALATNNCEGVDMAQLEYKLLEDTYTADTLTIAEANTIFATAGAAVAMPGDRVAPGASGTVNGGFVTASTDGPAAMANHPHMIFIIRANGASMQYFNVDVATLTQD